MLRPVALFKNHVWLFFAILWCAGCDSKTARPVDTSELEPDGGAPDSSTDSGEWTQDIPDELHEDVVGDTPVDTIRLCNGSESLCDTQFNEVVFAATHNAMSNETDGWLAPNQNFPMKQQLEDGIRAMLIDTYFWNDLEVLCHGICEIGSRPLADAFAELVLFLEENPNEVVALLIEDHLDVDKTAAVFNETGLTNLVYTHTPNTPWPTLGEMIDAGTRVVVTAENQGPPPTWYHHMWDLVFDTPYSFKSVDEFSCELNRGDAENDLFLLNHWLSTPLPTQDGAKQVNQYDVLYTRAVQCMQTYGRKPNFVAVDFYSDGNLFDVVRDLNQL
ncbi:MAG: hypothetical protein HUU55_10600 [Myxococcales bacterium]|nr:hypothetical protein [Myxococcales bacterium]